MRNASYIHPSHDSILELWRTFPNAEIQVDHVLVNFDLRRIKGQTSLLRSMRKVNKIVMVISCLIITARAIDVTKFPINIARSEQSSHTPGGSHQRL